MSDSVRDERWEGGWLHGFTLTHYTAQCQQRLSALPDTTNMRRDLHCPHIAAQVSLPIVRQFVKSVEEKALGVKVLKGVRPDQQLVKVVNDQLVELMGGQQEGLNDPRDGPQARHLPNPPQ